MMPLVLPRIIMAAILLLGSPKDSRSLLIPSAINRMEGFSSGSSQPLLFGNAVGLLLNGIILPQLGRDGAVQLRLHGHIQHAANPQLPPFAWFSGGRTEPPCCFSSFFTPDQYV